MESGHTYGDAPHSLRSGRDSPIVSRDAAQNPTSRLSTHGHTLFVLHAESFVSTSLRRTLVCEGAFRGSVLCARPSSRSTAVGSVLNRTLPRRQSTAAGKVSWLQGQ